MGWGGVQGLGRGGPGAVVPGGVGGRGTGPRDGANFATCVVFLTFLTRIKRRKMMFFEGCPVGSGGTHRSWPGGQGGKPRALVAGEGWGGVEEGWVQTLKNTLDPRLGLGGGPRASVPGG